jgi:hypothetical protein
LTRSPSSGSVVDQFRCYGELSLVRPSVMLKGMMPPRHTGVNPASFNIPATNHIRALHSVSRRERVALE